LLVRRQGDGECRGEREYPAIGEHLPRVACATLRDDARGARVLSRRAETRESARASEVNHEQDAPAPSGKQGEGSGHRSDGRTSGVERSGATREERDRER